MAQLAKQWNALDATTQGSWQALADTAQSATLTGQRSTHTAYGQFVAHNSSIINSGGLPINTAPTSPDLILLPRSVSAQAASAAASPSPSSRPSLTRTT